MKHFRTLALCALVACDDDGAATVADSQVVDAVVDAASDAALDAALDATPPDAAVDAAPDAAPAAAADAAPIGAEPCPRNDDGRCDVVGWLTAPTAYPASVDHHTTLTTQDGAGARLHVFGGILSDDLGGAVEVYAKARHAQIAGDTVEAFVDAPDLPFPIAFHAQIVVQDQVFLLGGITQDAQGIGANPAYLAGRVVDGQVAQWRAGALPQEVRVHPTGEALGNRLYLIGGTGAQGAVLDSVRVATLGPDGPGPFEPAPALPAPRSHHASIVVNGHILVLGGFTTRQVPMPAVLRSVHDATGALTGWEEVGTLPDTPWTSSALVHRGWLWLVGGGEGEGADAHFVATVRGAPLDAEGRPGAFEIFDRPLPLARSHVHQTPVHQGFVYSVGGRIASGGGLRSTNRVLVGELW